MKSITVVAVGPVHQADTNSPPRERADLTAEVNQHRGRGRAIILQVMREFQSQRARENSYRRGEIIRAIRERESQRARENSYGRGEMIRAIRESENQRARENR